MNLRLDGSPQLAKNVQQLVKQLKLKVKLNNSFLSVHQFASLTILGRMKTPIEGHRLLLSSMLDEIVDEFGGFPGSTRFATVKEWSESIASILEVLHQNKLDSNDNWNRLLVVVRWITEKTLDITNRRCVSKLSFFPSLHSLRP